MNLEELLEALGEAQADRDTFAAAIARVAVLDTDGLDADRQIDAHVARGDNAETVFYAGAALMLATVLNALREPLAADGD